MTDSSKKYIKHQKTLSSLNSMREFFTTEKKEIKKVSKHAKKVSRQDTLKERINFENITKEVSENRLDGDFAARTIIFNLKENKTSFAGHDLDTYNDVVFKTTDMRKPKKLVIKSKQ
jgi:hypothetical protein